MQTRLGMIYVPDIPCYTIARQILGGLVVYSLQSRILSSSIQHKSLSKLKHHGITSQNLISNKSYQNLHIT